LDAPVRPDFTLSPPRYPQWRQQKEGDLTRLLHAGSNTALFLIEQANEAEANLSAIQDAPRANARFSGAEPHSQGARGAARASGKGAQASGGVVPARRAGDIQAGTSRARCGKAASEEGGFRAFASRRIAPDPFRVYLVLQVAGRRAAAARHSDLAQACGKGDGAQRDQAQDPRGVQARAGGAGRGGRPRAPSLRRKARS